MLSANPGRAPLRRTVLARGLAVASCCTAGAAVLSSPAKAAAATACVLSHNEAKKWHVKAAKDVEEHLGLTYKPPADLDNRIHHIYCKGGRALAWYYIVKKRLRKGHPQQRKASGDGYDSEVVFSLDTARVCRGNVVFRIKYLPDNAFDIPTAFPDAAAVMFCKKKTDEDNKL